MGVQTLPLEIDLTVYAGTTLHRQFRWRPNGTPQDFTGWAALLLIGPRGGKALVELSTANDGVALSADGLITVRMNSEATAALTGQNLYYQLDLIHYAEALTVRFLRGRVGVVRDVARAP